MGTAGCVALVQYGIVDILSKVACWQNITNHILLFFEKKINHQ